MSSWLDVALQLVPFGFLVAIIWLFVRPTFARRLLSRTREKSIYRQRSNGLPTRAVSGFSLPYVAFAWALLFASGVIFAPLVHQDPIDLEKQYRPYMLFGMFPFSIAALFIHLRPNHSRELKYTLVLIPLGWQLFLAGAIVRQPFALFDSWLEAGIALLISLVTLPLAFWWVSIFVAEMLSLPRLLQRWDYGARQFPRFYAQIFSIVRTPTFGWIILVGLFIAPTIAIVLLGARYVLIEAFRRHPILYLRSFHHEQATTIFGRAIAPAVASFGVIEALVHRHQTGSSLLARASIWHFGLFATVSDADWQKWVTEAISRCSLVVVDCTMWTESVDWEVQLALREMPPDRVLIVTSDARSSGVTTGLFALSYSTDRNGVSRLRDEVSSWACKAFRYDPRKTQRIGIVVFFLMIVAVLVALTAILTPQ